MPLVKPLTPKQKKLLESLEFYMSKNGYPPTLREITLMINDNGRTAALSTAQYYIEVLKQKGYLNKETGAERGISYRHHFTQVPKLGVIAAGKPIEPIEDKTFIEVPSSIKLNNSSQYFALEVRGDSMEDMGVIDGDTIIVRHQLHAENGQTVVAITENGATLKVLRKENDQFWLEPRNEKYNPIYPLSLEIRGILVGLIRSQQTLNFQ